MYQDLKQLFSCRDPQKVLKIRCFSGLLQVLEAQMLCLQARFALHQDGLLRWLLPVFTPHPDLKQPPELLLVWGSNHLSTSADGILAPEVSSTIREGSKVILIDPFGRNLAKRSELWLQIKPGTDLLLAIGMIKVIKVEFLVVADLFMTPTAQMADIVLPVATHFKFDDLGFYGLPFGKILARPKIVDPPGECKSDVKIINELAKRLKLEDVF